MRRKKILITGASSGLGEGMARLFAAKGAELALCARRLDKLEVLRAELLRDHPGAKVLLRPLDVNDHDAVFETFRAFRDELGGLDRVIVNAGLGKGQALGTGRFRANRQTAETNFIAVLAQMEAAMEIFRAQGDGHLVVVSSVTAFHGAARAVTTYAATKAGIASLAEGLRLELRRDGSPIKVSTLYPGYIRTAINEKVKRTPFIVDLETGCRAMVDAIERERPEASVPRWPWAPIGFAMRHLPDALVSKML